MRLIPTKYFLADTGIIAALILLALPLHFWRAIALVSVAVVWNVIGFRQGRE